MVSLYPECPEAMSCVWQALVMKSWFSHLPDTSICVKGRIAKRHHSLSTWSVDHKERNKDLKISVQQFNHLRYSKKKERQFFMYPWPDLLNINNAVNVTVWMFLVAILSLLFSCFTSHTPIILRDESALKYSPSFIIHTTGWEWVLQFQHRWTKECFISLVT